MDSSQAPLLFWFAPKSKRGSPDLRQSDIIVYNKPKLPDEPQYEEYDLVAFIRDLRAMKGPIESPYPLQ